MKEQVKNNTNDRRIFSMIFSVCLLGSFVFFTGCGSSTSVETAEQSGSGSSVASADPEKDVRDAVTKFLNAVCEGKDEEVFQMFTPKARAVCDEKDRLPSVPASDTAEFNIDTVRLISPNEAQVHTIMVDYDLKGNRIEDSIAWALRKTDEGWKIAGTAYVFVDGMEPIVVNFESKEAIAQAERQVIQQEKEILAQMQKMRSEIGQQTQQTLDPEQQVQQQRQIKPAPQQSPQAQGQQPRIQR